MCIFIVPRKHRHLADEIIAAIRNSRLSLSTSLELAEEALRQSFPCQPAKKLIAGHRYGRLEECYGCHAWRNGKQVSNSNEVYLIAYQFDGEKLQCSTVWGGCYFKRIRQGIILFEL